MSEPQRARHGEFSSPDNHSYCRLFKELGLEMTGHGPSLFGNRLVRTRMPGGVEGGGEKPPPIRLAPLLSSSLSETLLFLRVFRLRRWMPHWTLACTVHSEKQSPTTAFSRRFFELSMAFRK